MDNNTSSPIPQKDPGKKVKGYFLLLLKLSLLLAAVLLLEFILGKVFGAIQDDRISLALRSYQNGYFSMDPYFITVQNLGNGYSFMSGVLSRFIFYLFMGYLMYAVLFAILLFIKILRNYLARIMKTLLYFLIAFCFYISFFIPEKKTTFDLKKQEMTVTIYKMFILPHRVTMAFSAVPEIRYEYSEDYDQQAHENHIYINYYIEHGDMKFTLGDREVDSYDLWPGKKKDWKPSGKVEEEAKRTATLLNQLIRPDK